jgi:2-polyprenyl-3-methyl-5-hydroxy-6-metoxy-1,4-benzoquinol methylase
MMPLRYAIDRPAPGSLHHRQRISIEGWLYAENNSLPLRVSAHAEGSEIGATQFFYIRPDVVQALQLEASARTGFRFLAVMANADRATSAEIEIRAEFADHSTVSLGAIPLTLTRSDFTDGPYGDLCNPQRTGLLHREHIYSSGYPLEQPSGDCLSLLLDYLKPGSSLLDVGCGIGAYCDALQERGFSWIGCETNAACLDELGKRRRPHRAIRIPLLPWSRQRLPACDREFDAVMAIEVLEHIRKPDPFLAEIARVSRHQAIFSVPNMEILPFMADRLVAPWHLLEGDHRNFFTRFNLRPLLEKYFRRVEVLDYSRHPLPSPDGLPLPYHLFALCEV